MPNYRLAPECIFPGALYDVISVYFHLVQDLGIAPKNIIFAGDSAGGALSLALVLYLKDQELEGIGGVIAMSPWAGMSYLIHNLLPHK